MLKRNENIDKRCRPVSKGKRGDGPVVYWMSRDQRAADNWALLWAQQEAMSRDKGLQVIFCHNPVDGFITARHALFALKGLAELQQTFISYNIDFIMLEGDPVETIPYHLKKCDGHVLAIDFSPLRRKRRQLVCICERISLPIYEIDSHNIIPAWVISDKKEYGAYTIRPKINRLLPDYLTDFPVLQPHPTQNLTIADSIDVPCLAAQAANQRVAELSWLYPGESAARSAMAHVLKSLADYAVNRNGPNKEAQSNMSPYLHFGQLSPQRLAWEVDKSDLSAEVRESYLEELIVRRELAEISAFMKHRMITLKDFPTGRRRALMNIDTIPGSIDIH